MSLGCPTLHRGFEIEPESMKWIIQHTNANMVETGFFETCSTSYANMSGILPCCLEAGGLLLLLRVCRRASHKKSG